MVTMTLLRNATMSVVVVLLGTVLATGPVLGNHIYDTYGDRGYVWLAHYNDFGFFSVTSDNCNDREPGAFNRIENSTAGTSEFSTRWPSGIRMTQFSCTGTVTEAIDIKIAYSDFDVTHGGSTAAGENHSTLAPSSWCAIWPSAPDYPCGSHPSKVHINLDFWNGASNTSRERLIMHETGHSMGLAHHCSSDSIMNDGSLGCNSGSWTQVMVYKPTDRTGVKNVYPCWICP